VFGWRENRDGKWRGENMEEKWDFHLFGSGKKTEKK
jgi:hypothetical protein